LSDFVLDASVGLAWFLDNPVPALATRARTALERGSRARVPSLWALEMANGFATAERRGAVRSPLIDYCLDELEVMLVSAIAPAGGEISVRQAISVVREFRLTAYDSAYLETARRERLPLATLDRELIAAAPKAGVELFR
jgi:predicted nucleic acid-binding protein